VEKAVLSGKVGEYEQRETTGGRTTTQLDTTTIVAEEERARRIEVVLPRAPGHSQVA